MEWHKVEETALNEHLWVMTEVAKHPARGVLCRTTWVGETKSGTVAAVDGSVIHLPGQVEDFLSAPAEESEAEGGGE